ncbi:response regulator transcription factor [Citrifermentans pelophilum]|jgi:DNA-binding response OmpR family regulator|uniref:response regulator transcription factor n=1 Tax=Geoanaerobacter pelophilus TaxID=60036 RepID=UPI001FEBADEE|nr:response regulator transcription factor [Geoanaerobacter pelophilus]
MIVDDEPYIRETVQEILTFHGIGLLSAASGDECLQYLREGFRGVILLDIMMPGKNGWETIREIAAAGLQSGNIIAMLTALDTPDDQMDGLQELVMDYITKPFEPSEFVASLRSYLSCLEQMEHEVQ